MSASRSNAPYYFVPGPSRWPVLAGLSLLLTMIGASAWVNHVSWGSYVNIAGVMLTVIVMYNWFGDAISESESGKYSARIDVSYRWSMSWFIFSEVMFFFAFFGALFYARMIAMPWLDGESNNAMTAEILWPDFSAHWPMTKTPGGIETNAMPWQGLPLYNTLILLTSSVTLQFAHVALEQGKRLQLRLMLLHLS